MIAATVTLGFQGRVIDAANGGRPRRAAAESRVSRKVAILSGDRVPAESRLLTVAPAARPASGTGTNNKREGTLHEDRSAR
jgi:hypothetical protein